MKKILLALVFIGLYQFSADAKSKFDKNYKVCTVNNKYKICGQDDPLVANTKTTANEAKYVSLRRMDTYVHLGYATTYSSKRNPRIQVSYDDPAAPYEGKESLINDGVKKNIERNINYLDNSVQLPPNDGGLSDK